jgi:hypothetical protein
MNLSNISEGQKFKNYKMLCESLEDKVKTGNSKKAQLEEWKRFFKYSKEGHKFVIEAIYQTPMEREENRGGARRMLPYAKRMDNILMYMLNEINDGKITMPIMPLLLELNMINKNYKVGSNNQKKASEYLKISELEIEEFFNTSRKAFQYSVESMLDRLESKALIYWKKEKTIAVASVHTPINEMGNVKANYTVNHDQYGNESINVHSSYHQTTIHYRPANEEEIKLILEVEGEVLDKLECGSKQEIVYKNKWKEFNHYVRESLMNKGNILYYFDSYKITTNQTRLAREVKKIELSIMDDLEFDLERISLNSDIQLHLIEKLQNRHNKSIVQLLSGKQTETNVRRTKEEYIDKGVEMIDTFIGMTAQEIGEEILKVKA